MRMHADFERLPASCPRFLAIAAAEDIKAVLVVVIELQSAV
jgi:hypothetical protein